MQQTGVILYSLERLHSPKKNSKKSNLWTKDSIDAFVSAGDILANVGGLSISIKGGKTLVATILTCGASDGAIVAVLHQVVSGELVSTGFFSKSLNATQKIIPLLIGSCWVYF